MDLTAEVGILKDDVKLLKAEIKNTLKEIRTAVLNADNPFTGGAASASGKPSSPTTDAPPAPEQRPQADLPETPSGAPDWTHAPGPSPAPPSQPPPNFTPSQDSAVLAQGGFHPHAPGAGQPWSLLTIAGLMEWAEEAVEALGRSRFEILIDLTAATNLLPAETTEVLRRIAALSPTNETGDHRMNVVECLVVLRQLEALVNGENITRLPLHRDQRTRAA